MRQKARKFGLTLAALMLALLLVGMAAVIPGSVNAQDDGPSPAIRDLSGGGTEGSGGRIPIGPPPSSPAEDNIIFEQLPSPDDDPYWNGYGSESNPYWTCLCFEDFWGLTADITDIHWYAAVSGDPEGTEFQIIFYEDSGGSPGAPVVTFSNVVPTSTYDHPSNYGFSVWRFDVADLGMPVSLTQGWVSIQKTYSPNDWIFYWLTSPYGNNNAIQQWCYGYIDYNLAFALTGMPEAPIPPNLKYLHAEGGWMNITDPLGTQWHELWPLFCRQYHLSGWEDNGDGVLSPCDRIDMNEKPNGELRPYHVENVTITLLVKPAENHVVDEVFLPLESPLQGADESMYIELEGGYDPAILTAPNCTYWHEIYPKFCRQYHLVDWIDSGNPNGELSFCDYVLLQPERVPPTCLMDEDFSGSWPPSGWTQDEPWEWTQSPTSNAGGTPPEASLYWLYISGNYSYLDSKPVDTTGAPSLTLEFKSFIDDYCYNGSYNCTVYTRADGGDEWTDVTPWSNPIYSNVGPGTYQVDISSDIGSGTQVRFEFDGISWCIDYWYVDDVRICYPVWWHVEDVAIDIVVTPETPPVGGEAYPVNKASLLAPWIAVGVLLPGGISWYILRRRRAQS